MLVTSWNRFAALQAISTNRRHKYQNITLFTVNLKWKRASLFLASKPYWKLLKKCKNQTVFVFRGLRVKALVTNLKTHTKKVFSSLLNSWLPSISKWSPFKVFLQVISILLNLRTRSFVWNLENKMLVLYCPGLLRSRKLLQVNAANITLFTQNVV